MALRYFPPSLFSAFSTRPRQVEQTQDPREAVRVRLLRELGVVLPGPAGGSQPSAIWPSSEDLVRELMRQLRERERQALGEDYYYR